MFGCRHKYSKSEVRGSKYVQYCIKCGKVDICGDICDHDYVIVGKKTYQELERSYSSYGDVVGKVQREAVIVKCNKCQKTSYM